MKNTSLGVLVFLFFACQNQVSTSNYFTIQGQTMGTYYRITCQGAMTEQIDNAIKTTLKDVNQGVNHYDPTSSISRFNQAASTLVIDTTTYGQHFYRNLLAAKAIYEATNGAFDPTVMPLVNYWGFGYTEKKAVTKVDSIMVDSLNELVGFYHITVSSNRTNPVVTKSYPNIELDFSAIAKGYGVDKVGTLLESKGIKNYLVDIGGEARAKGINSKGTAWILGINTPKSEASTSAIVAKIALDNRAMATSGNYRNFYEVGGVKYAHTLNPKTGYPELNTLLSATVLAKDCMTADGYATAFLTMGLDKAYDIASNNEGLEAYFLFARKDGSMGVKYTDGIKDFIIEFD